MNTTGKFGFGNTAGAGSLWRDPGDHYCFRLRQIVIRRLAIKHFRFTDNIEIHIGTDSGKLRRAIQRRTFAECLVIVNQEGRLHAIVFQNEYPFAFYQLITGNALILTRLAAVYIHIPLQFYYTLPRQIPYNMR